MSRPADIYHISEWGDYVPGVFLVGAYQETLGDLLNLWGDTHVVNVRLNERDEVEYDSEIVGYTVAEVLSYVEYAPKMIVQRILSSAEKAVRGGRITPTERRETMRAFEAGLQGYTYYEHNH